MTRLLFANFARLFKGTMFKTAAKLTVGMAVYIYIKRAVVLHNYPFDIHKEEVRYIERFTFPAMLYLFIIAAIITAVFIGTDYSDNTIRNKLIAGHKRPAIYLANLVTCAAAGLLIYFEFMALCFGIGKLFAIEIGMKPHQLAGYVLLGALTMTALIAVFVFVAMLNHSRSASAVIALLILISMFAAEQIIRDKLRETEFYGGDGLYYYMLVEGESEGEEPHYKDMNGEANPRYVGGAKRIIMQNIYDAMALGQANHIENARADKIPTMTAYSLGIITVFTGTGLALFRKKNIR